MNAMLFAVLLASYIGSGSAYSYTFGAADGPTNWDTISNQCAASVNARQSPVDLINAEFYPNLETPDFSADYNADHTVSLSNGGSHVKFQFTKATAPYLTLYLNNETIKYVLDSGHYHWGESGIGGSEHTIEGKQYKAELHLVHYDETETDLTAAVAAGADKLLVLGVLIDAGNTAGHTSFNTIKNQFTTIQSTSSSPITINVNPSTLLPSTRNFYNYEGGLTTPGCQGVVQWFIFTEPIYIPSSTMDTHFYGASAPQTSAGAAQGPNYRPIQDIGSRTIYTNSANTVQMSGTTLICLLMYKSFF